MKVLFNERGGAAPKVLIAVVIVAIIVIAGYFILGGKPEKKAAEAAEAYIAALQKRDVDGVYKYNGVYQRRREIIVQRPGGGKEEAMKELFEEMKASFEGVSPTADLRAQWVEKFLFIPGANFRVLGVEMVMDTENPSQPSSERVNAVVTVAAEYPDRDKAPDLHGPVKTVNYKLLMVHSSNVSRVLRREVSIKRWLFMSVSADHDTLKYW